MSHRAREKSKLRGGQENIPARPLQEVDFSFPVLFIGKDLEDMDEAEAYDSLIGGDDGDDEPEEIVGPEELYEREGEEGDVLAGASIVYLRAQELRKSGFELSIALRKASDEARRGRLDPYDYGFDM